MPTPTIFEQDGQDATLGGRISLAREASGLTVAQVVKRLGVRVTTYSAWEADRSEPRANKLVALAGILNVSPPYLLSGLGAQPDTSGNDETKINTIRAQVNTMEKQLKDANRTLRRLKEMLAQAR